MVWCMYNEHVIVIILRSVNVGRVIKGTLCNSHTGVGNTEGDGHCDVVCHANCTQCKGAIRRSVVTAISNPP